MTCVTTISYATLINSQPGVAFYPSRGLHQGDPISPYLYLICAKSLSLLLNEAEISLKIKVFGWLGAIPPSITSFLWTIVLCYVEPPEEKGWKSKRLLDVHEDALGQGINKNKTWIFISSNIDGDLRNQILTLADVSSCSNQEQYLGFPIMVGANNYQTFEAIKDKVWNCISNWKNAFLSQVGKEVLLKSIVQAIPTYTMSMFLLPRKVYKNIASLTAKF